MQKMNNKDVEYLRKKFLQLEIYLIMAFEIVQLNAESFKRITVVIVLILTCMAQSF